MNGNSFGTIFRITTWGESHGGALGVIVDGCPSGLALAPQDFAEDMARRRGGGNSFTTPRKEADLVEIESGVFEGITTGAPIALRIVSSAQKSSDYEEFRGRPRPGHADLTAYLKHGHVDHRGGGRFSARETAARAAAGVVAKKLLAHVGAEVTAWIDRVGPLAIEDEDQDWANSASLTDLKARRDASPLLTPARNADVLLGAAERLREAGDSWGGSLRCRVDGLPVGLGEPIFDKLPAVLAHALMSLPAAVAFEIGGGRAASDLPGSALRDPIVATKAGPRPESNQHGGIQGGLTTGLPLYLGVSFHAPTSIPRPIQSVDLKTGEAVTLTVGGRHDAFPLPRAVPMVEAMVAIVLADALLRAGRLPENLGA
ncbi:MAG: chorismate synthase [Proteobacteria bacterium]|nr:MAG: chorismate synthase [Pseudomonadota bacterium]